MPVTVDFTRPVGSYPVEAMDWNTGNPFDISKYYPSTAGLLFLGRDHDCAHTRYWIDGGLILELQTGSANQAFGLFVARPAGAVNQIRIATVFDFVQSLKQEVKTSPPPPRQTLPFIGSLGVVANDANVPTGLSASDKRVGATCVFNYDPDSPATVPPSASPSEQRLRLNAPASMYSNPRPNNDFHEFQFLRAPLSPHAPGRPLAEFTLEMTATAGTEPNFATAWMRLSVSPAAFGPDGGPANAVTSKVFHDLDNVTYAGVALAITDTSTTGLQPSMGPFRARVKKLEVDFI